MILLLRSHATRISALTDDFKDPGEAAAGVQCEYDLVNSMREYLFRRNVNMYHVRRKLALVSLIFILCIYRVCIGVTFAVVRNSIG